MQHVKHRFVKLADALNPIAYLSPHSYFPLTSGRTRLQPVDLVGRVVVDDADPDGVAGVLEAEPLHHPLSAY
jgi:hypothetical protein